MNRRAFLAILVLAAAVAAALRLPELGLRPMHTDEAVHAEKLRALMERGEYRYNPLEYHGPALNYFTLPVLALSGRPRYADLREWQLRILPALFGVALLLLLAGCADGLGRPAAALAAVLMAVSPAMVFYSRYYIMEMLLAFFTVAAIVFGWRYARSGRLGWAAAAGAAVGLMHATKETWVLSGGAAAVALAVAWAWGRWVRGDGPRTRPFGNDVPVGDIRGEAPRLRALHVLAALAVAAGVSVALFSSFGTNWRGPADSVLTYVYNLSRAGGGADATAGHLHVHPWDYYLRLLLYERHGRGPLWTQSLIVALALAGAAAAFVPRRQVADGAGHRSLLRFLAVYSFLLLGIYSAIPYKTPWCVVAPLTGLILLAGAGAAAIVRWLRKLPLQVAAGAVLAAGTAQLAWQAYRADFDPRYVASNYNPYVYAQALRGAADLGLRVEQVAAVAPGGFAAMIVKVVATDHHDFWPLPWYLRRLPPGHVGYYEHPASGQVEYDSPNVAMYVVTTAAWDELPKSLRDELTDPRKYHMSYFGLRPDVALAVFTRRDLWERFLETVRSRRRASTAPATTTRGQADRGDGNNGK